MTKMDDKLATIYIVRHGETKWNAIRKIQGQLDSPLTLNGLRQAKNIAKKFKNIKFDAIYSSDLLRAQKTAEIIKLNRQLKIVTKEALRERTWGRFNGKLAEEYIEETKHLLEEYQQLSDKEKWKFKFDTEYENSEEVVSRFITLLREIAVAYSNKTVLIVTHGGVIATFLAHVGFIKISEVKSAKFKNAGYIKLLSDGVDFFIKEVIGYEKRKNFYE